MSRLDTLKDLYQSGRANFPYDVHIKLPVSVRNDVSHCNQILPFRRMMHFVEFGKFPTNSCQVFTKLMQSHTNRALN